MSVRIYQVDAFCREIFSGNPAAVCPVGPWPEDELLQSMAAENNLAEMAFYVRDGERFHLRWFTPTVEVDLCGHATLATAHVLFEHEGYEGERIVFTSRSGELTVDRRDGLLHLNFPADVVRPVEISAEVLSWFPGAPAPTEAYKGRSDYMLVFESEELIAGLVPNLSELGKADARGVIVTAAGAADAAERVDFVSRFFAPQSGIAEDPVTGSAHTTLVPYWAGRLGKTQLTAIQLSARKGFLQCRDLGERVEISGIAKTYMEGRIHHKAFAQRPWVEALNNTVRTIKKLAEKRGVDLNEKHIAEKMGMTEAELRACLSGESKVPKKLMTELWPAYEYLLKEHIRADRLKSLRDDMDRVQRMAEKDRVTITYEEIARRIGVTPETLNGYLDGSIEVPEGLSQVFYEAFKSDLFRNIGFVRMSGIAKARSWDLADEDEV